MIARRAFLLGAPAALAGCAFFRPARQEPDVAAMNGFVAVGDRIIVNGAITPEAVARFDELAASREGITTLQLEGVTGDQGSAEAMAFGRKVRALGLATAAPSGAVVRGAGLDVFLAGQPRSVEAGASFVLRGRNMARAAEYDAYLREMTGDGRVSAFLNDDASRLRPQALELFEIQKLGLATGDVAQPFGLIGQEVKE